MFTEIWRHGHHGPENAGGTGGLIEEGERRDRTREEMEEEAKLYRALFVNDSDGAGDDVDS